MGALLHSPAEVDKALLEFALTGTYAAAERNLDAQGHKITRQTIAGWHKRFPERYAEIASHHARQVEEVIVQQARESALQAAEVEHAALALEMERIGKGDVRDAASSARNAATVKGINVDKLLTLSGRPNQVVVHRQADEVLKALVAKYPNVVSIDGHAEEVPDLPPAA